MSVKSAMCIYMNELDAAYSKYSFATGSYIKSIGKDNERELMARQNEASEVYALETEQARLAYERDVATIRDDYL